MEEREIMKLRHCLLFSLYHFYLDKKEEDDLSVSHIQ